MAEQRKPQHEEEPHASGDVTRDRDAAASSPSGSESAWTPSRAPFVFMRRFTEEMDRLLDDLEFGALTPSIELAEHGLGTWSPPVEAFARNGRFVVLADLPGLTRDDVRVEVQDEGLCLTGERRRPEHQESDKDWFRSERSYGCFLRIVPLPEGADPTRAEASFENGVLEVDMPFGGRRGPRRRIEIRTKASRDPGASASGPKVA